MTEADYARRRLVSASVIAGACAMLGVATISAVSPPQTRFRSSTQYVAVDVVVTDRDDRPVRGLTAADFEIAVGRTSQSIADFKEVSIPIGDRAVDLDAPRVPADVASNAAAAGSSRSIVLLLDDTGFQPSELIPVRRAMVGFLKALSPNDQVALTYVRRSDLSRDFSNDLGQLIEALNNRIAAFGLPPLGPPWRARTEALKNAIAALASSRDTRRAVVYVSEGICSPTRLGFSFDREECLDVIDRARKANVPIYTIDPRALPPSVDENMRIVAEATGGRGFVNLSDVPKAIHEIMADNANYYLLGFYPEPLVNDGQFHEIRVSVKRPGLRVRARTGYTADAAATPPPSLAHDVNKALCAGIDDSSLPIRAVFAPLRTTAGLTRTLVSVELAYPLPAGGLGALNDELRFGILALTPDGKIKASFQRNIQLTGKWKPSAHGTFMLNETLDLPAERLTLRVAVSSQALGRTGTAHFALDVPNFQQNSLQLTPLLLGASTNALDMATGLDVLRGLVPFQPTTQRTFTATEAVRVFARAFWRSNDAAAEAELNVTGPSAFTPRRVTLRGEVPSPGRRQAALDETLPLAGLSPGSYVLGVVVRLARGNLERRDVPFEIR